MKYHFFTITAQTPEPGQEALNPFCVQHRVVSVEKQFLVTNLQIGNQEAEALASRNRKLELPQPNSQAGAWELADIGVRLALAHARVDALFDPIIILSAGFWFGGKKQLLSAC